MHLCIHIQFFGPKSVHRMLQVWKSSSYPMDKQSPRYKKDAAPEDLPKAVEQPSLRVCQLVGDKLVLPRDIRGMFMQDPVHAPDWRDLLVKFDEQWGAAVATPAPTPAPGAPNPTSSSNSTPQDHGPKQEIFNFDWGSVFVDEPKSLDKLKAKYGSENLIEMPGLGSTSFLLFPGPCLFMMAKETVCLKASEAPVIMHGAGVWLLGDKAKKFAQNNPGKGIPCSWSDDQVRVVMEETGCHPTYS